MARLKAHRDTRDWLAAAFVMLLVAAGIWAAQVRSAGFISGSTAVVQLSESAPLPRNLPPAPPVEPVQYAEIAPEDAVKINAEVPFSTAPNPAARPFKLSVGGEDEARAVDCLTAAAYYEAATEGTDGMRAVAQVVINRLRHPAFPKSVCGVVFQGSERSTGCQFTFTCDGALARTPIPSLWRQAHDVAAAALTGKVYKPVGHSTHYHTNWVVPYWSGSLDKVAQVGTHLFFRWQGWWGTPGAFRGGYAGSEQPIAKMAALSPAHVGAADVQMAESDKPVSPEQLKDRGAKALKIVSPGGDAFVVVLDRKVPASQYPALALAACGQKEFCKFMGWTDPALAPKGFPIAEQAHQALSFSYLRNRSNGFEKMLWNCKEFARPDQSQCMKSS
ncbi:cell wall hydrolase [Sphingomonas sp. ID1715]|uniref:cell wall hydrolase n=1 Tax=Sphingomonas sp. ID1715 TaxID=1656898 RepID=UPI001488DF07|nr:cell wall hydrolase [Sphingomonas sp. ID1715]NNM75518.1 cell wall hydrolase [Sphingomonas sp. ID1715]